MGRSVHFSNMVRVNGRTGSSKRSVSTGRAEEQQRGVANAPDGIESGISSSQVVVLDAKSPRPVA